MIDDACYTPPRAKVAPGAASPRVLLHNPLHIILAPNNAPAPGAGNAGVIVGGFLLCHRYAVSGLSHSAMRPLTRSQRSQPGNDVRAGRKPRETSDDDYPSIARSGRWRVIRCKDDVQWIVQRDRRGGGSGRALRPWAGVAYVLNERFLTSVISRPSLGVPANTLSVLLAALPKHIAGGVA